MYCTIGDPRREQHLKSAIRKILIIAAALLILASVIAGLVMYFRTSTYSAVTFHMDTFISYSIHGRHPEKLAEALENKAGEMEALFDRFSKDSDISRINSNSGTMTEVSEETYKLIIESVRLAEETDGAFDPTVGILTELWGFGKDPHVPSEEELEEALRLVGYDRIMTEAKNSKYYVGIGEGQMLDLGAIAKGYCLASFKRIISESRTDHAIVSFGGNVLIWDNRGEEVFVGVRSPEEDVLSSAFVLALRGGVISTSGSYERFFYENGIKYSHILDPFDGNCVSGELLSISVISDDPVAADCLSTAYFVKGLDETLDALASGKISGAAIDKNNVIYISADLMEKISEDQVADSYTVEVVG